MNTTHTHERNGVLSRGRGLAALIGAVIVVALAFAPQATADVYWGNTGATEAIAKASLDGSDVNPALISVSAPCAIAADGEHVYWANAGTDRIGRALLNGGRVERSFITGVERPCGVAVTDTHIYWASLETGTISRANLDGSDVEPELITGIEQPTGLAVDDVHIFWTDVGSPNSIGRANLNGTGVDHEFISGLSGPIGLAIDEHYIYWTAGVVSSYAIGRANLNGTGVNPSLITTGVNLPSGIAVDDDHLYWSNYGNDTIARANRNGSNVRPTFITGADGPFGVAVDSATEPSCSPAVVATTESEPIEIQLGCEGGGLTYSVTSGPQNGQIADFDSLEGTLTYTPDAGFTGEDGFGFRAENSRGEALGEARIRIASEPSSAPSCSQVAVATTRNQPVEVTLACSGGGLTYAVTSQPANGEISGFDPLEGTLTYTPNAGFAGQDQLGFRATNSWGSAQEQAQIHVASEPASESPSCSGVNVSTSHGESVEVTLGCSGGGLTYAIGQSPAEGEVSGLNPATGKVTYSPRPGFRGRDSFRFTASNELGSATETVTVDVRAAANSFRLGKPKRKVKKGAAKLPATVPGAGVLVLRGKGVKRARARVSRASTMRLPVRAKGRNRARLGAKGKARVKVMVTFRPVGGDPRKLPKRIRLVKR